MLNHRGGQRSYGDKRFHDVTVPTSTFVSSRNKRRQRPDYARLCKIVAITVVTLALYLFITCNHDSSLVWTSNTKKALLFLGKNESTKLSYQSYQSESGNISIVSLGENYCRRNAVVILAQKKHATYQRDSYGMLLKAIDLLAKNYISIDQHAENMDLFVFNTGDFGTTDLLVLESLLPSRSGILKLVNLNGTGFWSLPSWHEKDNPSDWIDSDIFPVGYRHMCRWFGVKIWQFFEELNTALGCNYRHLLRIDEDSLILSPIRYDVFDYMLSNNFVYGFRMCAYELEYNRRIAPWLNRWKIQNPMKRDIHRDLCGFYNNFFIADLHFFTSSPVQRYLRNLDRQGFIYRKRYGDLMVHSTAVYAYAEPHQIHRFLDFTYSHVTRDHILHPEQGCVVWGGIQAGYADPNAESTLDVYYRENIHDRHCTANTSYILEPDLSPTYQHIPNNWKGKVRLKTIVAGKVELPGRGEDSG